MNLPSRVKGMIFAAGLGTRLVPFTLTMPKALVPVGGVPMLERTIHRMASAGITDIVVNIHHHADKIRQFLRDKDNFGLNIMLSDETDCLLDTGGGILHARSFLNNADAVLVHNADILTDLDLAEMLNHHFQHANDATLLVAPRKTTRYLYFDSADRLIGWKNLKSGAVLPDTFCPDPSDTPLAFGGIHVISPSIISELDSYATDPAFSIIPFYVARCHNLHIAAYQPQSHYQWFDIGTPEKLQTAEIAINSINNE